MGGGSMDIWVVGILELGGIGWMGGMGVGEGGRGRVKGVGEGREGMAWGQKILTLPKNI